jgi:K+-sensing histidine kinase KdpD
MNKPHVMFNPLTFVAMNVFEVEIFSTYQSMVEITKKGIAYFITVNIQRIHAINNVVEERKDYHLRKTN